MAEIRRYIVLTAPRTGSTMLCDALTASGVAGRPEEYFHRRALQNVGDPQKSAEGLRNYLREIVSQNCTPNHVFGMKLHFNQFRSVFLNSPIGRGAGLSFLKGFQKFILLSRRDKILQAISQMLAHESQLWSSHDKSQEQRSGRDFEGEDLRAITELLRDGVAEESGWRRALSELEVPFCDITYEDLAGDTNGTFTQIQDYLDIPELCDGQLLASTVKVVNSAQALRMKQEYLLAIGAKT
jgi:trehalose 2-sulfotransferase